jgi:hypothetical protein
MIIYYIILYNWLFINNIYIILLLFYIINK